MTTRGYADDKSAVLARLKKVEGQVRGIHKMIEDDRYCIEVLEQISAATRALQGVALHLSHRGMRSQLRMRIFRNVHRFGPNPIAFGR